MNPRGRGAAENEELGENKKMKSIVVEEQEQEQEKGSEGESETRFVDTLHNVLKRVDGFTLGRAACVNKLWRKAARDNWRWETIALWLLASSGGLKALGLE